jgi:type II secretory pathway component PulJ
MAAPAPGGAHDQARSGGTLPEVVISMIILSVGLLALQVFALSAGRSLALSERTTRNSVAAVTALEAAVALLLLDSVPEALDCVLADGGRLVRESVEQPELQRTRVAVSLVPAPGASAQSGFVLTTIVRTQGDFRPATSSDGCP